MTRASARIAVAGGAARAFLRAELDDVRFVALARDESAAETLRDTDMLVFVADGSEAPAAGPTAALAAAARERGILVAALIVGRSGSGSSALLATMRDAADMVMVVRDPADVQAVVAALR